MPVEEIVDGREGRPRRTWRALVLGLGVGLAVGSALGWMAWPRLVWERPAQPVRFSHQAHARQEVACSACHFRGAGGRFSGLPGVSVCAGCHAEQSGGTSQAARDIDKLVGEYVARRRDPAWVSLTRQPDHVLFVHAPHLDQACASCHPDMTRDDTPDVRVNRISGSTSRAMTMARCRACHQQRQAPDACASCHR